MPLESSRKHPVIKFLDMVGYTAMMQEDEEKTQEALKQEGRKQTRLIR